MRNILIILTLCLVLLPGVISAEEMRGSELFRTHCQVCHGTQGRGDGPAAQALQPRPRDLSKRPYKQGCGPGAIVRTLRSGVEGSAMPSFSETLSEDEMWALGQFVRSLQTGCCEK